MTDIITLRGFVATTPAAITTTEGLAITSFRLASNQRRFDKPTQNWVDGETNWYTVTTFRQLATNVAVSVHKGDRVVVSGKLRIREWTKDEKKGINVDIEAEALGHDLFWGTAAFSRSAGNASSASEAPADGAADSAAALSADNRSSNDFPTAAELAASDSGLQLVGSDVEAPF